MYLSIPYTVFKESTSFERNRNRKFVSQKNAVLRIWSKKTAFFNCWRVGSVLNNIPNSYNIYMDLFLCIKQYTSNSFKMNDMGELIKRDRSAKNLSILLVPFHVFHIHYVYLRNSFCPPLVAPLLIHYGWHHFFSKFYLSSELEDAHTLHSLKWLQRPDIWTIFPKKWAFIL